MLDEILKWAFTNPWGIAVTSGLAIALIVAIVARASRGIRTLLGVIWISLVASCQSTQD